MSDTTPASYIGKYLIHEELGRGGFGTVYRATDTTLDRVVALKILDPFLTRDPGFLERFRREAVGAARLEHPNIVPVYEVGEIEGRSFIAMKYLPGRSLDKLLADGRLPVERTLHILAQIAAALDFAHGKGLIHRDIKPSNIIVGPDEASGDPDHTTLTDFGLARVSDQSVLTTLGHALGTPAYMAPEQLDVDRQAEVGPASDVYSFAVVVYEMLAGRPPFVGSTPAVMVAHLAKEPLPITEFNADLPPALWDALAPGLVKEIAIRPKTAGELVAALLVELGQAKKRPIVVKTAPPEADDSQTHAVEIQRPVVDTASSSQRQRWPLWLALGGAAVILLALALRGVRVFPGQSTPTPVVGVTKEAVEKTARVTEAPPTDVVTALPTSTHTSTLTSTLIPTAAPTATPTLTQIATVTGSPTPTSTEPAAVVPLPGRFAASSVDPAQASPAWTNSPHANTRSEAFNHWNSTLPMEIPASCAKCHSTPGFLDFLGADGSIPNRMDKNASVGTVITCDVCHNAIASVKTRVVFPSGSEIADLGGEALCIECHQGRESTLSVNRQIVDTFKLTDRDLDTVVNPVVTMDQTIGRPITYTFGFRNIHYLAAAATQYGTETRGGYEYSWSTYVSRNNHAPNFGTCTSCHDAHTLEVRFDKCAKCHPSAGTPTDIRVNQHDYDGDGDTKEGIAFEAARLQEMLLDAIKIYGKEIAKSDIGYDAAVYPYFFSDANTNSRLDQGERAYSSWTPRLLKAAYNYQVSIKDPGAYAHNAKYIIQLLYDSLEDLGKGGIKVNLTGMTRPEVEN